MNIASNEPAREMSGVSPEMPDDIGCQTSADTEGLYLSSMEHDACGVGLVANLNGKPDRSVVEDAMTMLLNMDHRGGCGCDPRNGDGAGILLRIPDEFFREVLASQSVTLPAAGEYGVGMWFLPQNPVLREACEHILIKMAAKLDLEVLYRRVVPVDPRHLGPAGRASMPFIEQVFLTCAGCETQETLERKLYVLRRAVTHAVRREAPDAEADFYFLSLSCQTIIYKGQFITSQLAPFFPDLLDQRLASSVALVHSRFSTNTFPRWRLAHPFRYLAHNGEINTIRGNLNWMKSKEVVMDSPLFSAEELELLKPVCEPNGSDSRNLDAVVELLVMSGRSLPHALMMVIPEAWEDNHLIDTTRKAFYEYHSSFMEPWDGPAAVCFTDGRYAGAILDRNGLRPCRYTLTTTGRLIMASEAGALPVPPELVAEKGRLQPGSMLVADLSTGRLLRDEEIKNEICTRQPYEMWLNDFKKEVAQLPDPAEPPLPPPGLALRTRQRIFGITDEEVKTVLTPMAADGNEPIGSMGSDTPLAVLSKKPQHLANYFHQLFAQVSNPPIDPIRERLVMSLRTWIGGSGNLLIETPEHCRQYALTTPVLSTAEFHKIAALNEPYFRARTLAITFSKAEGLENALARICAEAEAAVDAGYSVLILSDRTAGPDQYPVPALMACAALHHFLIRQSKRHRADLILDTGEAREVHHFATLIGYGALAIHPYLAYETIAYAPQAESPELHGLPVEQLKRNYIKAIQKGLLKIFAKMGISTVQSYHGSQIFEIVGLDKSVVNQCFNGTVSRLGGLNFAGIEREVTERAKEAIRVNGKPVLERGGVYQWKKDGEEHLFNPESIHLLQKAARTGDWEVYEKYAAAINRNQDRAVTLRHLFEFKKGNPIPLDQVEPVENILRRFATGAMSFGSISHEAHTTLAIAMNRIGGKSNSGEGGEDYIRFLPLANGDSANSAIKQVASGRFGVTSYYLSQAKELQIKIAQGAKPGEGGQLPGHKVDDWIGRVRHSTPGVGLISPPPHHDIYSIEDLAQLIFDLKNANPSARISVKLVAAAGVGTIAAGVAKAKADHVVIAGFDGGTGASPLSSLRYAGLPWELGLAEAHQTLVKNRLRDRVTLQTDGQIRTGRDLAIATLLGAEEWGVATAALVAAGCILMRKCHLNTCPVGVATQDPYLRTLFTGKPEDLVRFFTLLAEDLRRYMAQLGFRTVNDMVGRADQLIPREDLSFWKWKTLDLKPLFHREPAAPGDACFATTQQDHEIHEVLDRRLILLAKPAIEEGKSVTGAFAIRNTDRAVGTMLSYEISKRYAHIGLPPGSIHYRFKGSAGQSFGAFAAPGLKLELEGEANDYFGKGLSGGNLVIYPSRNMTSGVKTTVIGNVALYGATSGEVYIGGAAGERFAVRNSGATAVVEGVGDHGCEYMTGGTVVVLGPTGRNFASGMSGGIAYIYDPEKTFARNCNKEMVVFDPLDDEDMATLQRYISRHAHYTGSAIAQRISLDWDNVLYDFTKVIPKEYKAILQKNKPLETAQKAV